MTTEEAPCISCGDVLSFYIKPSDNTKMEAFCQRCKGVREKDIGRPASLKKEEFSKFQKEKNATKV